jgi:hypothetical protein
VWIRWKLGVPRDTSKYRTDKKGAEERELDEQCRPCKERSGMNNEMNQQCKVYSFCFTSK